MKRYLMTIEYVGTNYKGFQLQRGLKGQTVQGVIEDALLKVYLKPIKIFASGRLDAGVHAKDLKAHFDAPDNINESQMVNAINHFLPSDIAVKKVKEVKDDFHARYNVVKKTYGYKMYVSQVKSPMEDVFKKQLYKMPDINLMKKASELLLGEHNFKAFMNQKSAVKSTIRTIYEVKLKVEGNNIDFEITGNGFLYNMVRIIVGTLLEVGYNKLTVEQFEKILKEKERTLACKTAQAKALTLLSVEY